MTKLESTVKKDIIRGLNSAIDSEKSDDDNVITVHFYFNIVLNVLLN